MRFYLVLFFAFLLFDTVACSSVEKNIPMAGLETDFIQLSQNYLYAARTGDSIQSYQDTLRKADPDFLAAQLKTDHQKLAFWLNVYNASTQFLLKKNPEKYTSRSAFFSDKQIAVAGKQLSLDMIEHGILRRSKIKWSLGYLNKLFPPAFEKKFRVAKLDYRIHFALNCGAKSCPPIAFYTPDELDEQLDLAMRSYLDTEAKYIKEANILELPAIMSWFRGDFGGKNNIVTLLQNLEYLPKGADPKIEFKDYDWTLYLDNYNTEEDGK